MNRFLTFIIGVLCGCIITILGIMFYINNINTDTMKPIDNGGMYRPGDMGEPIQKTNGDMQGIPNGDVQGMPMNFNQR